MADAAEKLGDKDAEGASAKAPVPKRSKFLVLLLLVNTFAFVGLTYVMVTFMNSEKSKPTVENYIEGSVEDAAKTAESSGGFTIPLDYFLVNLSGELGHKLFKVKMDFDVDSAEVQEEITKRMPQVRDIIIILLSSKNYSQVSTPKGKEKLKEEIRDTVNSFLTKGKLNKVLFTEFIYS